MVREEREEEKKNRWFFDEIIELDYLGREG